MEDIKASDIMIVEDWESPKWRLNNIYSIVDAKGELISFEMNHEQEDLYDQMWFWNLVLKARQMGFSTFIDLMLLDQCLWVPNTRAGIIAQTKDDVETLFHNKIRKSYLALPQIMRDTIGLKNINRTEIELGNGSSLRAGMSMRSDTLQILHVSEFGKICAKAPDRAMEVVTGALPTVGVGGMVFIESTAEGQDGYFHDYAMEALEARDQGRRLSKRSFKLHFYAWHEKPTNRLDPETVVLTDNDHLYFNKLSAERGIGLDDEQKAWYANESKKMKGKMHRENPSYPKEAFQAALEGAYYEKEMLWLRQNQRITTVPWDPALPVNTFWDFGVSTNNETTIWFHQRNGLRNQFIRYYEKEGEGLAHFVKVASEFGYTWGKHYLPHDGASRVQAEKAETREQILNRLGFKNTEIVPRTNDIGNDIELTKERFPTIWMDKENCADGIAALDAYVRERNARLNQFKNVPLHNWASNGADSFRCFGKGYQPTKAIPSHQQKKPKIQNWRVV